MKYSLLLFTLLLSFGTKAQTYFSMSIDSSNRTYSGTESWLDNNFKFHNSTGLSKEFNWIRTDLCPMPVGWQAVVCDCEACYNSYTKTGGHVGDSCAIGLSYYFSPTAVMGTHSSLFEIYDPADSINSTTSAVFTINNGCSPLNTNEHLLSSVLMYPIPCHDQLHLSFSANVYTQIDVFDMFGRTLIKQDIGMNKSASTLPFEKLVSGIYFIRLTDNQGSTALIRKIQKD